MIVSDSSFISKSPVLFLQSKVSKYSSLYLDIKVITRQSSLKTKRQNSEESVQSRELLYTTGVFTGKNFAIGCIGNRGAFDLLIVVVLEVLGE